MEIYNGLLDEQGNRMSLQSYMYADDIALVTWDKNGVTAKNNLEAAVILIKDELKNIKLEMSEEKTQIIKFQDRKQEPKKGLQELFLPRRSYQR